MDDALFPFGYGLSYTSFEIGPGGLSKKSITSDESIQLTLPVRNTGKRLGTEIVQVYVRKIGDTDGPLKTLKGFKRIELASGKSGQVTIDLPPSSFEFYNRDQLKMMVSPGEYEILYGNSSSMKHLSSVMLTID